MNRIPRHWVAQAAMAALLTGCASETLNWNSWITEQAPGSSRSPREAPLQSVRMVKPHATMAPERARWWGLWHGWMGVDKAIDAKIVISHITDDQVAIQYSRSDGGPFVLHGRFRNGMLDADWGRGGIVQMRLRSSGNEMEIVQRQRDINGVPVMLYGVLTRQPAPDKEFLTNN